MAKLFLTSINLNKNELQFALAHPLTSHPNSPSEAQFYYNSLDKTIYAYNGSSWLDIGGIVRTISQSNTPAITIGGTANDVTIAISDADTTNSGLISSAHWDLLNEASSLNVVNTLVSRDGSGDISVGNITANKITGLTDMSNGDASDGATKGYVDSKVSSSVNFKGGYNASTNTPILDTQNNNIAILIGDMYVVETSGTFFTIEVEVGDTLIAEVEMAENSTDPAESKWTIVNKNLNDASIKVAYENNPDTNAYTDSELAKLGGIEALADVTDAINVNNAGAVMETDTSTSNMDFVIDEDSMASNSNTKVPTQQSVKSYVDNATGAGLGYYSVAFGDGSLTSININHQLNEQFTSVQIYKTLTPFNQVYCDVNLTDANNCELVFNVAPTLNEYTIVVTG